MDDSGHPQGRVAKPPVGLPRLIARKETGVIEGDTVTSLCGVPAAAWEYRLRTYSALEWVLDRVRVITNITFVYSPASISSRKVSLPPHKFVRN